ncbi:MAG: cupin domain-containing protein [Deltaproteobacteria bacterium]|nr:cupin domain-containing protein [Deltaproteobacteria bacterium]
MSLEVLANKTRFAKSYLSEIETLKKEPPISTLSRIAFALEVDLSFLLTGQRNDPGAKKISIVRKTERHSSEGPFGSRGYIYEPLSHKKADRLMDAYIVTIGPDFPPQPFLHEGQEVVYVIDGTQEFMYDGETYFMEPGDSFCFDSDKPHYSRTVGKKTGKILVVLAARGSRNL